MSKRCIVNINNQKKTFEVDGIFDWGMNELLFNYKSNLISNTNWLEDGYTINEILNQSDFISLKNSILKILKKIIQDLGVNSINFTLEKYHDIILDEDTHQKIISKTRNLSNEDFDFDIDLITNRCSKIVKKKLTSLNKILGNSHVQLRINRPKSLDINPPHRDSYIAAFQNSLNLWIPISGCDINSNLPVYPKSHFFNENQIYKTENKGAKINGNVYNVPCIFKTKEGMSLSRYEIPYGSALIFTPFLIHGAAFNDNLFETRISLELRLEMV